MIYLILILIIVLVMGTSLWTPGGILLLDFTLSDTVSFSWSNPIGDTFSRILGWGLGYGPGSKIAIFLILVLAGYLGILIARKVGKMLAIHEIWKNRFLQVLGVLFFVMNPFSYERMLTQPMIYAGVVALGYGLYFLLFGKSYWYAGISYGLALALFPHASYMIVLILGIYIVLFARSRYAILGVFKVAGATLLLNLNWILAPYFGVKNTDVISGFSWDNFAAFATQKLGSFDVFSTNLFLYGFWGEKYDNHFAHPDILSPFWYIGGMLVLGLVIFGGYRLMQVMGRRYVIFFVLLIFISLGFAVGMSSPVTAPLTSWMIEHIPLWQGYREPQKWTGIITLAEGVLFIFAIGYVYQRYISDMMSGGALFFAVLMILYVWSPGVLGGYRGQMMTTVYPESYYIVQSHLQQNDIDDKNILILPWHAYLGCKWFNRPTIANPVANMFRGLPTINPDTIEVGDILYANNIKDDEKSAAEEFVHTGEIGPLRKYNILYILVMNQCAGSEELTPILQESIRKRDITLEYEEEDISLYRLR